MFQGKGKNNLGKDFRTSGDGYAGQAKSLNNLSVKDSGEFHPVEIECLASPQGGETALISSVSANGFHGFAGSMSGRGAIL